MPYRRSLSKRKIRDLAIQRAKILYAAAKSIVETDLFLSQKYILLLRRILMKARVSIPKDWEFKICRKCNTLLIPGVTARIRLRSNRISHITYTCLICKNKKRFLIKNK